RSRAACAPPFPISTCSRVGTTSRTSRRLPPESAGCARRACVSGNRSPVESLQGQLLVSSPALVDPNFRRTVVLIAHHDEDGAMGLVLSRPSDVTAGDAVPALQSLPGADEPVYVGGPVQPDAFMVLAEFDDVRTAAAPIFG